MHWRRFKVLINDEMVASNMDIKTATLLVRVLFEEYNNEPNMTVSVREMEGVGFNE